MTCFCAQLLYHKQNFNETKLLSPKNLLRNKRETLWLSLVYQNKTIFTAMIVDRFDH